MPCCAYLHSSSITTHRHPHTSVKRPILLFALTTLLAAATFARAEIGIISVADAKG